MKYFSRATPKTRRIKAAGFSAVELLICLSIIGVLLGSGVALTQQTIENHELRSSAQQVVAKLHEIHVRATARKKQLRFFVSKSCIFENLEQSASTASPSNNFCLPKSLEFFEAAFAKTTAGVQREMLFYSDGSVSAGHLVIRSRKNKECTIIISRLGRIRESCDE